MIGQGKSKDGKKIRPSFTDPTASSKSKRKDSMVEQKPVCKRQDSMSITSSVPSNGSGRRGTYTDMTKSQLLAQEPLDISNIPTLISLGVFTLIDDPRQKSNMVMGRSTKKTEQKKLYAINKFDLEGMRWVAKAFSSNKLNSIEQILMKDFFTKDYVQALYNPQIQMNLKELKKHINSTLLPLIPHNETHTFSLRLQPNDVATFFEWFVLQYWLQIQAHTKKGDNALLQLSPDNNKLNLMMGLLRRYHRKHPITSEITSFLEKAYEYRLWQIKELLESRIKSYVTAAALKNGMAGWKNAQQEPSKTLTLSIKNLGLEQTDVAALLNKRTYVYDDLVRLNTWFNTQKLSYRQWSAYQQVFPDAVSLEMKAESQSSLKSEVPISAESQLFDTVDDDDESFSDREVEQHDAMTFDVADLSNSGLPLDEDEETSDSDDGDFYDTGVGKTNFNFKAPLTEQKHQVKEPTIEKSTSDVSAPTIESSVIEEQKRPLSKLEQRRSSVNVKISAAERGAYEEQERREQQERSNHIRKLYAADSSDSEDLEDVDTEVIINSTKITNLAKRRELVVPSAYNLKKYDTRGHSKMYSTNNEKEETVSLNASDDASAKSVVKKESRIPSTMPEDLSDNPNRRSGTLILEEKASEGIVPITFENIQIEAYAAASGLDKLRKHFLSNSNTLEDSLNIYNLYKDIEEILSKKTGGTDDTLFQIANVLKAYAGSEEQIEDEILVQLEAEEEELTGDATVEKILFGIDESQHPENFIGALRAYLIDKRQLSESLEDTFTDMQPAEIHAESKSFVDTKNSVPIPESLQAVYAIITEATENLKSPLHIMQLCKKINEALMAFENDNNSNQLAENLTQYFMNFSQAFGYVLDRNTIQTYFQQQVRDIDSFSPSSLTFGQEVEQERIDNYVEQLHASIIDILREKLSVETQQILFSSLNDEEKISAIVKDLTDPEGDVEPDVLSYVLNRFTADDFTSLLSYEFIAEREQIKRRAEELANDCLDALQHENQKTATLFGSDERFPLLVKYFESVMLKDSQVDQQNCLQALTSRELWQEYFKKFITSTLQAGQKEAKEDLPNTAAVLEQSELDAVLNDDVKLMQQAMGGLHSAYNSPEYQRMRELKKQASEEAIQQLEEEVQQATEMTEDEKQAWMSQTFMRLGNGAVASLAKTYAQECLIEIASANEENGDFYGQERLFQLMIQYFESVLLGSENRVFLEQLTEDVPKSWQKYFSEFIIEKIAKDKKTREIKRQASTASLDQSSENAVVESKPDMPIVNSIDTVLHSNEDNHDVSNDTMRLKQRMSQAKPFMRSVSLDSGAGRRSTTVRKQTSAENFSLTSSEFLGLTDDSEKLEISPLFELQVSQNQEHEDDREEDESAAPESKSNDVPQVLEESHVELDPIGYRHYETDFVEDDDKSFVSTTTQSMGEDSTINENEDDETSHYDNDDEEKEDDADNEPLYSLKNLNSLSDLSINPMRKKEEDELSEISELSESSEGYDGGTDTSNEKAAPFYSAVGDDRSIVSAADTKGSRISDASTIKWNRTRPLVDDNSYLEHKSDATPESDLILQKPLKRVASLSLKRAFDRWRQKTLDADLVSNESSSVISAQRTSSSSGHLSGGNSESDEINSNHSESGLKKKKPWWQRTYSYLRKKAVKAYNSISGDSKEKTLEQSNDEVVRPEAFNLMTDNEEKEDGSSVSALSLEQDDKMNSGLSSGDSQVNSENVDTTELEDLEDEESAHEISAAADELAELEDEESLYTIGTAVDELGELEEKPQVKPQVKKELEQPFNPLNFRSIDDMNMRFVKVQNLFKLLRTLIKTPAGDFVQFADNTETLETLQTLTLAYRYSQHKDLEFPHLRKNINLVVDCLRRIELELISLQKNKNKLRPKDKKSLEAYLREWNDVMGAEPNSDFSIFAELIDSQKETLPQVLSRYKNYYADELEPSTVVDCIQKLALQLDIQHKSPHGLSLIPSGSMLMSNEEQWWSKKQWKAIEPDNSISEENTLDASYQDDDASLQSINKIDQLELGENEQERRAENKIRVKLGYLDNDHGGRALVTAAADRSGEANNKVRIELKLMKDGLQQLNQQKVVETQAIEILNSATLAYGKFLAKNGGRIPDSHWKTMSISPSNNNSAIMMYGAMIALGVPCEAITFNMHHYKGRNTGIHAYADLGLQPGLNKLPNNGEEFVANFKQMLGKNAERLIMSADAEIFKIQQSVHATNVLNNPLKKQNVQLISTALGIEAKQARQEVTEIFRNTLQ